jgi:hypothetical protein
MILLNILLSRNSAFPSKSSSKVGNSTSNCSIFESSRLSGLTSLSSFLVSCMKFLIRSSDCWHIFWKMKRGSPRKYIELFFRFVELCWGI